MPDEAALAEDEAVVEGTELVVADATLLLLLVPVNQPKSNGSLDDDAALEEDVPELDEEAPEEVEDEEEPDEVPLAELEPLAAVDVQGDCAEMERRGEAFVSCRSLPVKKCTHTSKHRAPPTSCRPVRGCPGCLRHY